MSITLEACEAMVRGSISSCKHKVYFSLWRLCHEPRNQQTGGGASTSLDMTSSANASHQAQCTPQKLFFEPESVSENQYVTTLAPAEAMNIHVHNTRGLRGNGQRVNLFLQAQSLLFTLAFVSRTKKSADRRRGLYFFGHDIKCQRLSSGSVYSTHV